MLGVLARQHTLVADIDDLQWADADSLALLAEILRAPDPPPLLLLGTVRTSTDGAELRSVADLAERLGKEVHEVRLEPLSPSESIELARVLSQEVSPASIVAVEAIAEEAGGHPLFIAELVRHRPEKGGSAGVHLDDVIWSRASALEGAARELLDVVAIAGVPIRQDVAAQVVGIESAHLMRVAAALRASQLVRTSGPHPEDSIEPYHDRVRETLVGRSNPDDGKRWHRRLAEALEEGARGDAETLALHWRAAGERAKALDHFLAAADHAIDVLAFDRAADLYGRAIDLSDDEPERVQELLKKRADALSYAGRCAEAAGEFSKLAAVGPRSETQEMNRRAALEFLKSGRVDEGLDRMRLVLADAGMRFAPNVVFALVAILFRRAYLRLRGLAFTPRRQEEIPPAVRLRIDVSWTVAMGLMTIELFHACDFLTRHVLLTLASGDRTGLARGLSLLVGQISIEGSRSRRRTEQLLARCYELVEGQGAYVRGWAQAGDGCADYSMGRWKSAKEMSARAMQVFATGTSFEKNNVLLFHLWSLYYTGEIRELSSLTRALVEDARQRGDQFLEHYLRTGFPLVTWLAADKPAEAREGLETMIKRWSRRGFHPQHWWGLTGTMLAALYDGGTGAAYDHLCRQWGALQRSLLPRMQNVRIEAWDMRARGALALVRAPSDAQSETLVRKAAADARRIERERMPWATPLAQSIHAAVAWYRGAREKALEQLAVAEQAFRAADMGAFAAATQRRRGELRGGDEGRALVEAADAWMRAQAIEQPEKMANIFAPRFAQ
jgi:tetratricopeptide (TPR) repeat protein